MAAYPDAELEALMSDLESDLVERKESAADGRKIRRNVCAFANDLPGNGRPGVVLVGVRDDGSGASLPIDDALLTGLANIRVEGAISPLPSQETHDSPIIVRPLHNPETAAPVPTATCPSDRTSEA